MRDYDKVQQAGNVAGIEKFRENEHKKGFDNIDVGYCKKRINEEVKELNVAMDDLFDSTLNFSLTDYLDNLSKTRYEAADIRNFCDMLIYQCDQLIDENSPQNKT